MKKEYKNPKIEVITMDAGEIAIPVTSDSTKDPGASNAKANMLFGNEDILPDIMPQIGPGIKPTIPETPE